MDNNKPIFAICHGPQLLIAAKILDGRQATGYKSIKVDMENACATYKDEELEKRREKWIALPLVSRGVLGKYAHNVSCASIGSVTDNFKNR